VPYYATIDAATEKFYWGAANKVMRCNFDGSQFEVLFDAEDGVSGVVGVAVDPTGGYVYWTDFNANSIHRGKIDGSGEIETLFTGRQGPVGIVVNPTTGKLYWGQNTNSKIFEGNVSGLGTPVEIATTGSGVTGVAADFTNGKLYWQNFTDETIERSDLDGMNKETLFDAMEGANACAGLSVDPTNGLLYSLDANGILLRGNSDGSGSLTQIHDISATNFNAQGVGVTPDGMTVLFTGDVNIFSGAADGTGDVTTIVDNTNSISRPKGIALDLDNQKLYAVDTQGTAGVNPNISRVDLEFSLLQPSARILDGTIESLFDANTDGIGEPGGIAHDVTNSLIYWTDPNNNRILRGATDGTGSPEELFNAGDGVNFPAAIQIDVSGGKIYWVDSGSDDINVGNADGTGAPTQLFTGNTAIGLGIDPDGGSIYWLDSGNAEVMKGNIDGSGMPVALYDGSDGVSSTVTDLALDLVNGYIYFHVVSIKAVLRGKTDGSEPLEVVADDITGTIYLALAEDSDGDGVPDAVDECDSDSNKSEAGVCGCGVADTDTDGDGTPDCNDQCSENPNKTEPSIDTEQQTTLQKRVKRLGKRIRKLKRFGGSITKIKRLRKRRRSAKTELAGLQPTC
jgi:sugar lactone lactonase YvrE